MPIILPALICRTARLFRPPFLSTMGALASCWYWEKDQSWGLRDEGEESRRMAWCLEV